MRSYMVELSSCHPPHRHWARQVTWLPYQGTVGGLDPPSSSLSDHLFLLRKGVPAGRISFNMAEASDDGDKITGIDDGNNKAESNSNDIYNNSSVISTDTYGNHNSKNSSSMGKITTKIAGEGNGRGYDSNIPAVFKAKVRNLSRKSNFSLNGMCCEAFLTWFSCVKFSVSQSRSTEVVLEPRLGPHTRFKRCAVNRELPLHRVVHTDTHKSRLLVAESGLNRARPEFVSQQNLTNDVSR